MTASRTGADGSPRFSRNRTSSSLSAGLFGLRSDSRNCLPVVVGAGLATPRNRSRPSAPRGRSLRPGCPGSGAGSGGAARRLWGSKTDPPGVEAPRRRIGVGGSLAATRRAAICVVRKGVIKTGDSRSRCRQGGRPVRRPGRWREERGPGTDSPETAPGVIFATWIQKPTEKPAVCHSPLAAVGPTDRPRHAPRAGLRRLMSEQPQRRV